jgi:LPXTG-site transpeptidase (sortase) family protein
MRRLRSALIGVGVMLISLGLLWHIGLLPGSRVSLPRPVALERPPITTPPPATASDGEAPAGRVPTPSRASVAPTPTLAPTATPAEQPQPAPTIVLTATSTEQPQPAPTVVLTAAPITLIAADAADRATPVTAPSGYAVRLVIPTIDLDTSVVQGGIVADGEGNWIWQTLPLVAVHYGDLTSLIGAAGNAVISGHVVTINEGNVFRNLYRLDIDDQIQVWDQHGREYDYHVVDIRLVPPSDTSAMAPTPDQTLTLITCGGTFDRARREFSDRLIVTAKPLAPDQ